MKYMKRQLLFLLLFFGTCLSVTHAADWNSFINNYGSNNYGTGTSTWRIATSSQWTFFANQGGVLVHDGLSWQHFSLNNRSEARCVVVSKHKDCVYVGGENEFGYLKPDASGMLRYHCVSEKLGKVYRSLGNVFDIYEVDGALYYRCDNYILIANNGNYRLIRAPHKIFSSVMSDMVLYVATDCGLYSLMGNKLVPAQGTEVLMGKRINAMFKYGKGIVITTANDGLFYYNGSEVMDFHTAADGLFLNAGICCASINNGLLAVGTIHNGLVLVDLKTGSTSVYNEINGLQSNTVLSVGFDDMGNVWAGLDYGIDYINLNAPFSYLYKSPYSYGMGKASLLKDGLLYLATDRGLFCTDYPVKFYNGHADIRKLDVPTGVAWNLYRYGNEVLCLHDKGIFSLVGTSVKKVTDIMGAWSCEKVEGHPDMLFVGVYEGMYLIRWTPNGWVNLGRVKGINGSGRYFKQVDALTLKVYNVALGNATLYQLDKSLLKATAGKVVKESFYESAQLQHKPALLFGNLGVGVQAMTLGKSRVVYPCNTGFLMYNQAKSEMKSVHAYIQRIVSTNSTDSVVYMANFTRKRTEVEVPYSMNSIRIEYGVPSRLMMPLVKFRYRLNNGNWTESVDGTSKEYSDMFEGKYRFEVEMLMGDGEVSHDFVEFRILPPWYRTIWAYLAYACLFFWLIAWSWRTENRRIERKKQAAVEQKDQEVKQMKVEINKLEKEKLDLELRHKSQEIADLMICVKRKNEILMEIKRGLVVAMNQLKVNQLKESRQQLVLINGKIDTNIEGDEILKRFEEQFDVVNNMFMQKLSTQYPSLNQNERMMCAYLRMNLSTKEMAPLLNISVRGVETMRYRLRKKLGLEREDNLMEFLNKL